MCKKLLVIALILQLTLPTISRAEGEETAPATDNRTTEKLIWGALSVLNFALVTSSFVNLQFYGDRANELEEVGLDAGPFWDASNREKMVLGVSALSFVFTLAAWKKSFDSPGIATTPVIRQPQNPRFLDEEKEPEPKGENTAFLAFDSQVRYDTLFSGSGQPDPADATQDQVLDLSVTTRVDTVFEDDAITESEWPVASQEAPVSEPLMEAAAPGTTTEEDMELPVDEIPAPKDDNLAALAEVAAAAEEDQSAPEDDQSALAEDPVAQLLASRQKQDVEFADESIAAITLPPETLVTTLALPEPAGDTVSYPFEVMPYAVHVSSFRSIEQAEVDEARWVKRGYLVLIEDAEVKGATWYRVHVGNFPSRNEARAEAANIQERYRHDFARVTKRDGF